MLALIVTAFYVIVSAGIFHDDYRVHHPSGDQEHRTLSGDAEVLTDLSVDDVCLLGFSLKYFPNSL